MSFEYLRHFFGEAHFLVIEVGATILVVLTVVRLVRRDISDLKSGKDKE